MNNNNAQELKPCPFCGCTNIRESYASVRDGYQLSCIDCNGSIYAYMPNAKSKCIEKWNNRPSPAKDEQVREEAYCTFPDCDCPHYSAGPEARSKYIVDSRECKKGAAPFISQHPAPKGQAEPKEREIQVGDKVLHKGKIETVVSVGEPNEEGESAGYWKGWYQKISRILNDSVIEVNSLKQRIAELEDANQCHAKLAWERGQRIEQLEAENKQLREGQGELTYVKHRAEAKQEAERWWHWCPTHEVYHKGEKDQVCSLCRTATKPSPDKNDV